MATSRKCVIIKKNKQGTKVTKVQNFNSGKSNIVNHEYNCIDNLNFVGTVIDYPLYDILVDLNGIPHKMEFDSDSLHSIISYDTYVKLWPVNPPFLYSAPNQCLMTWSPEKLNVAGYFCVNVSYNSSSVNLPLLVVEGKNKSLVDRSWLKLYA